MSWASWLDGYRGSPAGPNTDMDSYMTGQQAARDRNSAPIDGAGFTLLVTSPLLFTVFPAWGLSLYAASGGVFWLVSVANASARVTDTNGVGYLFAVVAWFAAFFLGIRVEKVASQFFLYRMVRTVSRWVAPFLIVIWMGTANGSFETMGQLVNRAKPETMFGGILVAILSHFVFRRADRLFFPVAKQVAKMEELAARGESLKRGFPKRVVYSLLWIVPVVAGSNLTIRLVVGSIMEDADRIAFYARYSSFVVVASLTIWLVLSIAGILPGTGRVAMTNEKLRQATL